jgi:hypothetical protein
MQGGIKGTFYFSTAVKKECPFNLVDPLAQGDVPTMEHAI